MLLSLIYKYANQIEVVKLWLVHGCMVHISCLDVVTTYTETINVQLELQLTPQ